MPVLSNNNKNLLHILSRYNLNLLEEVFLKGGIESCIDRDKKQFPLFKDFKGNSPLDYAY